MTLWLAMTTGAEGLRRTLPEPEDQMLIAVGIGGLVVWTAAAIFEGMVGGTSASSAVRVVALCAYAIVLLAGGWFWIRRPLTGSMRVHRRGVFVALLTLVAATLLTLGMGFLWSGFATPFDVASARYLSMPIDHRIPSLFAEGLRGGSVPAPLVGDWYSADRAPLQTGINLLFGEAAGRLSPIGLVAVDGIVAITSQMLFVVALVRLGRLITGSSLPGVIGGCAVALMPPMMIYGFYPWPKLLAAAFLVTAFSIALDLRTPNKGSDWARFGLVGVAVSFGLLSHGGGLFPAIGLGIVMLAIVILRRERLKRSLAHILLAVAGVLAPYALWVAYGRLTGEDRSRLIKWHFAGQVAPSEESAFATLASSYAAITPSQWLEFRLANIRALLGNQDVPRTVLDATDRFLTVTPWRVLEFHSTFFSGITVVLWLAALTLALMIVRRGPRVDRSAISLTTLWVVVTLVFWVVLMFLPGSSIPHQGSPLTFFLPTGVAAIVVAAIRPVIGIFALISQAVYFVYIAAPPNGSDFGFVIDNRPSGFALTVIALSIIAAAAALVTAARGSRLRIPR